MFRSKTSFPRPRFFGLSLHGRLKLSHRLSGGFGLLLLLIVMTIALALFQMQRMQQQMRSIVEVNMARITAAQAMVDAVKDVSVSLLGYSLAIDEADIKAQQQEVNERLTAYGAALTRFMALAEAQGAATLTDEARKRLSSAVRESQQINNVIAQNALSSGNTTGALASTNPQGVQQQWAEELQALVKAEQALGTETYQAARESFVQTRRLLLGVTAVALLVGMAAAFAILRSVTRPINHAIEHAQRIAQGDLTREIDAQGNDEMGLLLRSLSEMQSHLRRMIGKVHEAGGQIRNAANDLHAGSADLSARTEQTASNLQQTAASMEQLASLVDHGAQAGQEARQWVASASTVAAKGGAVMGNVVKTMEQIDQSSHRIGQIVGVIDGIAFQTNILALNAAVEAARAGDQGRGFAVVASEVRNLASRSAEAAREIKTLISGSVERIAVGTDLVRQAGTTMGEIVGAVERVQRTIDDMSTTLQAQRQGMGEVSAAVSQVDHMTQQNSAMAEQSAASTAVLKNESVRLQEVVEAFKV